jgi:hypothetical protein
MEVLRWWTAVVISDRVRLESQNGLNLIVSALKFVGAAPANFGWNMKYSLKDFSFFFRGSFAPFRLTVVKNTSLETPLNEIAIFPLINQSVATRCYTIDDERSVFWLFWRTRLKEQHRINLEPLHKDFRFVLHRYFNHHLIDTTEAGNTKNHVIQMTPSTHPFSMSFTLCRTIFPHSNYRHSKKIALFALTKDNRALNRFMFFVLEQNSFCLFYFIWNLTTVFS